MPVNADTVIKDIKEAKIAPLYFLQGEEPYYIDLISDLLEDTVVPEEQKGFNQMVLYGKEVKMTDVLTSAKRFPMMGERQLVLVKEAQEMGDLKRKEPAELLVNYLQNPVPSTILAFCYKYKTLDGRMALSKEIGKKAVLVNSKKLYDNQVPSWVESFLRTKNFDIEPKASNMIGGFIGNDLERIANEINKMLVNLKPGEKITAEHVQKYIGISKEYNAFELQGAIAEKNILKANYIVKYFASNPKNNPVIPLVAVLFSFFSKLLLVHASQDKNDKALAAALRINPYFVKEYLRASRHYNQFKTIENISHLRQADLRLKGIEDRISDGEILKELVYLLMH